MKLKLNEPGFTPFDVTITVESVQEARLLYHVLNQPDLWEILLKHGYKKEEYDLDVAEDFGYNERVIKVLGAYAK